MEKEIWKECSFFSLFFIFQNFETLGQGSLGPTQYFPESRGGVCVCVCVCVQELQAVGGGGTGSQLNFSCYMIKVKIEGEGYYQLWKLQPCPSSRTYL